MLLRSCKDDFYLCIINDILSLLGIIGCIDGNGNRSESHYSKVKGNPLRRVIGINRNFVTRGNTCVF